MTKLKPFKTRTNYDGDIIAEFEFYPTDIKKQEYKTEIKIEPIEFKFIEMKCECADFLYRKRECKHIKIAEKILNKFKKEILK